MPAGQPPNAGSGNIEKRNKRLISQLRKRDPDIDGDKIKLIMATDLTFDSELKQGFIVMYEDILAIYNESGKEELPLSDISGFLPAVPWQSCMSSPSSQSR